MAKACVLQICTTNIAAYTQYAFPMNLAYCLRHGYDYRVVHHDVATHAPTWGKVIYGLQALREHDLAAQGGANQPNDGGLLFILDADAVVVNKDIPLEAIADTTKAAVMVCENGPNGGAHLNAGALLLRRNRAALDFLTEVLRYADEVKPQLKWDLWHEQEVINELHACEPWMSMVEVFPVDAFNSYWQADLNDSTRFIYHFMARSLDDKVTVAKALHARYGAV